MKNDFILLELNHRNEIRADVNMTIKSLDITRIGQINVKIDTGCPYTSIPIRKPGISNEKVRLMKQADCADSSIKKEISFGVNDSKEKRESDKEQFRTKKYKDLLLLMLREYELFVDSFQFACKNFKENAENAALARTMGFESNKEYNGIMFLREITHTVNMFNDMGDIVRLYSKNPEAATTRLANLLSMVSEEESESV